MAIIESGQTVIYDDRTLRADSSSTTFRPASPAIGTILHNTTLDILEVWNGSAWKPQLSRTDLKPPNAYGWGLGTSGRLGDGTTISKLSPVSVVGGFTDWVQVSAADLHTVALRANGTAWSWGQNNIGILGDNTFTSRTSPVSVVGGFTDWVQVSAANLHTAAIRANGTAYAWGNNQSGQLGDNTITSRSSPVSVVGGFTDWVQISAGASHTTAIRVNGTAYAWGSNTNAKLGDGTTTSRSSPVSVVGGITDWVQVSAGYICTVAIRANGTAWGWGGNTQGQLGDNTTTTSSSPVSVVGGFTNWVQISAHELHTVAIRANGTAYAWGGNSVGQLGDNTTTSRSSPVSVVGGFTDWVQISAGGAYTVAIRANGTAWAWGLNTVGNLGDNTLISKRSPVSVVGGFTDWVQISAGNAHTIAIRG
jgi:alpha-tubulin suppressor-like RCC1 family protein